MAVEHSARTVRRTVWLALVCAGLGAVAGVLLSYVAPKHYEAHADVLIIPSSGTKAGDAINDRVIESYAVLMGSRRIANAVQGNLDVDLSVGEVDTALTAEVVEDSSVVRVTGTHTQPSTAASLSRLAASSFVDLLVASGNAIDTSAEVDPDETQPLIIATVIEESPAPTSAATPVRLIWALWGALAGAAFGALLSLTRRSADRRIRDSDELSTVTGAPLVGAFGYDRNASRDALATDLDPQHPRFEAARIMRTNLQFLNIDHDTTVLTVTSPLPGDGKSTVVADVAIALAHGGQSVVLVEGDLRRPRLGVMFDLPSPHGLTTALVGQAELSDAVQQTDVPGLDVLASGARPPNPSELLQTQAMSNLLTELSGEYDVVLIDAPPLLPVTDAALLAAASDGALLVVRHGRTTHEQLNTAMERLDAVDATLFGTVFTMVPARGSAKYGYGYGYAAPPPERDEEHRGRH